MSSDVVQIIFYTWSKRTVSWVNLGCLKLTILTITVGIRAKAEVETVLFQISFNTQIYDFLV